MQNAHTHTHTQITEEGESFDKEATATFPALKRLTKERDHIHMTSITVQLILAQHRLELHGATYMWGFFPVGMYDSTGWSNPQMWSKGIQKAHCAVIEEFPLCRSLQP